MTADDDERSYEVVGFVVPRHIVAGEFLEFFGRRHEILFVDLKTGRD